LRIYQAIACLSKWASRCKRDLCSGNVNLKECTMDKDRIAGAAKQVKGSVKEAAGKVTGDAKLQAEGKADKAEGKVQNAVGSMKDAAKDALSK
jgi:uncharacterized protein YjbJ (UPF0337 family)